MPCIVIENTFIAFTEGAPRLPEAKKRSKSAGAVFRHTEDTTDLHDSDEAIKEQLDRLNALVHSAPAARVLNKTIKTELSQNDKSKVSSGREVFPGTDDSSARPHVSTMTHVSLRAQVLPHVPMKSSSLIVPSTSSSNLEESQTMVDGQCATSEDNTVIEEGMTMLGATAMLRNIPYSYTLSELTLELNELGFSGKFHQLYWPGKQTRCGCGFAFVSLKTQRFFDEFKCALHGYRFKRFRERFCKKASVSSAKRQS